MLWARPFARIEANEDVVVTAISSNTLEVRPPPVEDREQHVAPFDRHLTKANSALVSIVGSIFSTMDIDQVNNNLNSSSIVE